MFNFFKTFLFFLPAYRTNKFPGVIVGKRRFCNDCGLFLFYRFLRKSLFITFRNSLLAFERFFKLDLLTFQDSLIVGSFLFILFKFVFRIFDIELFWNWNLAVFIYLIFISLQLNLMLSLRLWLASNVFIPLLNKEFYTWSTYDEDDYMSYEEAEETLLGLFPKPKSFNLIYFVLKPFFQPFFIFSIGLRLLIINEPYLFFFIQSGCILFLIFNKYLILASIFSFVISFSRFCFFISDFNSREFYISLSQVETINELIVPTFNIRNVYIMAYWSVRYLHNWPDYIAYTRKIHMQKDFNVWVRRRHFGFLQCKLKDLKDPIVENVNRIDLKFRKFYPNLIVFKTSKKNNIFMLVAKLLIYMISMWYFLINVDYDILSMVGGPLSIIAKKTHNTKNYWFRNEINPKENLFKTLNLPNNTFSRMENNHLTFYKLIDIHQELHLIKTNATTFDKLINSDLGKVRNPFNQYSYVRVCRTSKLPSNIINLEHTDVFEEVKISNLEVFFLIDNSRRALFFSKSDSLQEFFEFTSSDNIILPFYSPMAFSFLDPRVNLVDSQRALQVIIDFHFIMSQNKFSVEQQELHTERFLKLLQIQKEVNYITSQDSTMFNLNTDINMERLIRLGESLNNVLRKANEAPILVMRKFFSAMENLPLEQISVNFLTNLHKIPKVDGGESIQFLENQRPTSSPTLKSIKSFLED